MPYTKEDYKREAARELFQKMPPGERRKLLGQLPAAERLSGLSAQQIEAYLKELGKQAPSDGDAAPRNSAPV